MKISKSFIKNVESLRAEHEKKSASPLTLQEIGIFRGRVYNKNSPRYRFLTAVSSLLFMRASRQSREKMLLGKLAVLKDHPTAPLATKAFAKQLHEKAIENALKNVKTTPKATQEALVLIEQDKTTSEDAKKQLLAGLKAKFSASIDRYLEDLKKLRAKNKGSWLNFDTYLRSAWSYDNRKGVYPFIAYAVRLALIEKAALCEDQADVRTLMGNDFFYPYTREGGHAFGPVELVGFCQISKCSRGQVKKILSEWFSVWGQSPMRNTFFPVQMADKDNDIKKKNAPVFCLILKEMLKRAERSGVRKNGQFRIKIEKGMQVGLDGEPPKWLKDIFGKKLDYKIEGEIDPDAPCYLTVKKEYAGWSVTMSATYNAPLHL